MTEKDPLTPAAELLLHQYAYGCYNSGSYEKAVHTFRLLTLFRSLSPEYWYGLGSSLFALSKYEEAACAFQLACCYKPDDVRPKMYLAECFAYLEKIADAQKLIDEVKGSIGSNTCTLLQNELILVEKKVNALCQKH
jgi:tetratricopeptide (TPR) repeat protein